MLSECYQFCLDFFYKYSKIHYLYKIKNNFMAVLKVIEVLSSSDESWEDATRKAVAQAAKSLKNIRSVYVQDQSAAVKDGKITEFRVNVKITFEIE